LGLKDVKEKARRVAGYLMIKEKALIRILRVQPYLLMTTYKVDGDSVRSRQAMHESWICFP
jgi:hypothetical protein